MPTTCFVLFAPVEHLLYAQHSASEFHTDEQRISGQEITNKDGMLLMLVITPPWKYDNKV